MKMPPPTKGCQESAAVPFDTPQGDQPTQTFPAETVFHGNFAVFKKDFKR